MWRRVAAACAAVTAVAAWEASRASLLARSLATDLADSSSFGALGEGKLFQLLRAVSPGAVAGDDAHADVQRTVSMAAREKNGKERAKIREAMHGPQHVGKLVFLFVLLLLSVFRSPLAIPLSL